MRMLNTFFNEVTTQSNTAYRKRKLGKKKYFKNRKFTLSFGTLLIVFSGRKTRKTLFKKLLLLIKKKKNNNNNFV